MGAMPLEREDDIDWEAVAAIEGAKPRMVSKNRGHSTGSGWSLGLLATVPLQLLRPVERCSLLKE